MVVASEEQSEAEAKALIGTVCANPMAIDFFELLLQHHDYFNHADLNYLASLAVTLAFQERQPPAVQAALLRSLDAPIHTNHEEIHVYIRDGSLINMWGAERVLAQIIKAMFDQARVPMLRMHLQRESMVTWKQIITSGELGAHTIWIDRARIMACCVRVAVGDHMSTPSYKEILQMIDVGWLGWMDD